MKEYLAINLKQFIAENKSIDSVGDLVKAGKNSENAETVSIAENLEQQLQKGDVKNATVGKLYKALLSDQKSFIKTFGNIGKFEATHTDKKTNAEVQAVEIKDSNGKTDPDNIKVVSSDGQEKTLNKNVFNALYEKNSEDNNNIDNNQTSDNSNSETSQNEVKRVEYGTKRLANSIRNVFEKNGVKADDYSLIESANTKVLSSENAVIDDDFIKAYADTFSEALKNNEPELYQTLSESDNLSEQLVNYVTKGENLKASGDVSEANNIAETFSDIVSGSISKVSYGMTGMYGNNASVSIQLSNAENINTPNANESHELRDIMQSESISMYSGENASQNVKQIERTLISRGTDDTTREQIIENATMLENILNGTDVTINQVFNDVSTMTSYVIGEIKKDVGISTKYWEIFNANLKAIINTGEKAKADMVTEYVKVYTEAMKANQKDVYSEALINQNGTDISLELPFTILQGIMPANLKNAGKYRKVAGDIKSIIKKADQAIDEIKSQIKSAVQEESVTKEENALAGENKPNNTNGNTETEEVQAAKKPKNISLTRMGDFYEVFGDEALEVAEKLSLKPTHKNINGVKTAIVGFPVNVLEKYQNELGNNYNFVISANTDDAIQNQSNNTNNIIEHPYNVQNVSQDFMEAVDENMLSFIDKATGNPNDNKSIYTIGKTNYKLNRKIKEVTGIDTTLFTHSIKANSIRHIIKNHGINGSTDNSMANIDDIARMGYILRNFDNIEMLDSISKEYRDKNQQPSKMIKLSKRIDGTYYVVEAVPDANAKRLMVVTAYIKKASTQQTENVRALSSNVRNASVDVEASDNNISPNTQNVNSNVDTNIKNSATKDDISQDNDIKSNDTKENVVSTQPKKQSDEKSADTADTSDVAQNKDVSNDTDIIDHTKGANGMKLIDTKKSTLSNGQTLVTGVFELNSDKDFNRKTYKKENYDIFCGSKAPYVRNIYRLGTTFGHYGMAVDGRGYMVTHLPTGVGIKKTNTQEKAKALLKALDSKFPEPPITIEAFGDGYRCCGIDENIRASVNKVINSTLENLDKVTLPLKSKKELISYLKKHIGNKIGVTFNNGTEEIRKIVSVSDTKVVTENADGEKGTLTAKANELSYTDDGFVYTGGNGFTVTYRFIEDNAETENTTDKESKKNIAENKTNDNTKSLKDSPTSDTIEETKNEGEQDNDREKSNVLAGEGVADDRGLHTGADDVNDEERTEGNDKADRQNSREVLQGHTVDKTSGHTDGNDGERADRADDAGEATAEAQGADNGRGRGRDELLGRRDGSVRRVGGESEELTENTANKPDVIETEVKKVAKKRPSNKDNFVITDDIASEYDNTSPDVDDNVRAIEKLIELENSGRKPTDEEKRILAKYKGWGGIDTRAYNVIEKLDKLYSYEERMAMRSSENNAFFTPTKVIDSIYSGLKRLGFRGGNVLETSMGIGNFFGRMPANISSKSYLTGIELESYTARIAQMLYPGATVINMPFQDVAIKNGSYDLVIGNVPFGQNKISYNKKKYSLHNYFIVSSLDKVRDGGIVAVITSANTLDSYDTNARKTIMDKADVVACYKLPEKVFSRNANTDVQTDLLILRKRASGEKSKGDSILNVTTTPDGHKINEYFLKHPENILGTLSKGTNAWGEITTVLDDGDFYDKLNNAVNKLPKDIISGKSDLKPTESILSISDKPKFFEKGGKIYSDDGAGVATEVIKNADVAKKYIKVRDSYKALLTAYDNDLSENEIKPLREQLSQDYDDFFEKYGAITGDGKKKIGNKKTKNNTFLEADSDYYLVSGLEIYDAKNKKFSKSALFEKDTLRKKKVDSVDTASDALAVSLNESGRIDFKRMQELTSKSEEELLEELGGEIVYTPEGDYVLTDVYLSGNIYEKLEAVKGKPEFKEQEQMLEKVIPPKKEASDIAVKLGANYIDSKYIEEFAYKTFGTRLTIRKDVSGGWVIEGVRQSRYGDVVNVKYGCSAFNAVQLLEKILNDGDIKATKKVGSGKEAKTVFDPEMTDIAKQKADDIRLAFETWVFSDSERRTDIVNTYNKLYNNYRSLDYGKIAEKLTFDTMDKTIREKLYPHQRKGIARFLFGGNTLFAHGVGTGKTYGMIASVMEAKRMA